MSDELEQIKDMEKTLQQIKAPLARIEEDTFRKNVLPILLNPENAKLLNYVVGFTGSPFLGAIITRNGEDAYEMPALFDKRFDKSNILDVSGDGVTEKTRSIEKEGNRSSRSQIKQEREYMASIKGLFSSDTPLDTRERWRIVLEENGIDFNKFFGIKNEPKKTKQQTDDTSDWGEEEL